jgi:hypothetical protein
MKNMLLVLSVLIPTISFAQIECTGISFDLKKSEVPTYINLAKEGGEFFTVFSGKIEATTFKVVVRNDSETLHGSIENKNGDQLNFTGTFSKDGAYEFASMKGGNVIMPETLIGISCKNNL